MRINNIFFLLMISMVVIFLTAKSAISCKHQTQLILFYDESVIYNETEKFHQKGYIKQLACVLTTIAKSKGAFAIFEKRSTEYIDPSSDITQEVLDLLIKEYLAKK